MSILKSPICKIQTISSLLFLFFFIEGEISVVYSQNTLRSFPNEAFKDGEILKYRVHYGFIDAGEAVFEVKNENKIVENRNCHHIVATGQSLGAFNWFFKVDDRTETFIDRDAILPWIFIRKVNEGGYMFNQDVSFNHHKNIILSNGKTFDSIPNNIQDMVSALYFARCIDFSKSKPRDTFTIIGFVDDQVVPIKIRYIGKEVIESDLGKFQCLKFRPVVITGRIFKHEEDLNVWVTDDKNHIPVKIEAKIVVGSVKMDLKHYSGLSNPISIVKE